LTFFRGTSLTPVPPVASRQPDVRYFHIHEGDEIDEPLVASWIRQASELPGEKLFQEKTPEVVVAMRARRPGDERAREDRAEMRSIDRPTGNVASRLIDRRIRDLGGWRGETLARRPACGR
jgi:hypothetical protein